MSGQISESTEIGSVGKVTLTCAEPGGWKFTLKTDEGADGTERVVIGMSADEPSQPPVFSVTWFCTQRDVHHVWNSAAVHYGIPWKQAFDTAITMDSPVYSFIDANDGNRFTFACGETLRKVVFRSPINETKMGFDCKLDFFTEPEAPVSEYATEIRFDARAIPYWTAIGEASDWLCALNGIEPLPSPDAAFDPLYSTWYTFHQDVSASLVEEELALAAPLGMKTVILDDGWQIDEPIGNRPHNGYHLCGDWKPGRNFPDMAAHVRKAHALGYKYMVWYSVPFLGDRAANYARFKDKLLPFCCLGGWSMDPRFPEVREFLISTYERALKEWNIDGFKFDFINRFSFQGEDPAVAQNYAGRDIKSVPFAVDRLLTDAMKRLRAIKPDILIEFRQPYLGPCIRRFGNMIRAGDCPCSMVENRTRTARLRLTSGKTAVHADMLEWRGDETPESAARAILNVMFTVIQYSVRLKNLPESHLKMIKHWLDFSQTHREALVKGEFRPHDPANEYPLLEGESSGERVFGVYQENRVVPTGAPDREV